MILLDFKLVCFLRIITWRLIHEVGWLGFERWFVEILVIFYAILMLLRNRIIGSVWMLTHRERLDGILSEPIWIMMRIWKVLRPQRLTKIMIRLIVKTSVITKRLWGWLNVIMLKMINLTRNVSWLLHPDVSLFITRPLVVRLRRRGVELIPYCMIKPHGVRVDWALIALIRLSAGSSPVIILFIMIQVPYRVAVIILFLRGFWWTDTIVGLVEGVLIGGAVGFIGLHFLKKLLDVLGLVLEQVHLYSKTIII